MRRIALIGCGAIGSEIAKAIDEGYVAAELVAMFDIVREKCEDLRSKMRRAKPRIASSIDELLELKPDIVVEAASQEAVRQYGEKILSSGAWLVVLSVGALMDRDLLEKLLEAAQRSSAMILVPSGAIAGLDAIRALRRAGIDRVLLRTRKPPRSIKPCEAIKFDPSKVTQPTVVFRGRASEAVKLLPFNINVSAALSLASGKDAEVEIVADPSIDRNIHEIVVESKASRITIKVENVPSPSNPRTSYLASLSAVELLRRLCGGEKLVVGS
ncbi:MAG: aspartate dehydrogenase [Crenarchaeota archaeon]|nr:aspartate dehydrogenase [Thermoproteota archaeon]